MYGRTRWAALPVAFLLSSCGAFEGTEQDMLAKGRALFVKQDFDAACRVFTRVIEIDAEFRMDGTLTGKLRPDTGFIILGELPDKTTLTPKVAKQFDAFLRRASELDVPVIPLKKLLGPHDRPIILWDFRKGTVARTFPTGSHPTILALDFSSDGTQLARAGGTFLSGHAYAFHGEVRVFAALERGDGKQRGASPAERKDEVELSVRGVERTEDGISLKLVVTSKTPRKLFLSDTVFQFDFLVGERWLAGIKTTDFLSLPYDPSKAEDLASGRFVITREAGVPYEMTIRTGNLLVPFPVHKLCVLMINETF
jgi:hypothetical protein